MRLERQIALTDWVVSQRAWLEQKKPTLNDVVAYAQKVLGFNVSTESIKIIVASKGIDWDGRRTSLPIGRIGSKKPRANIGRTLARAIVDICNELGMTVDPGVANVARGRALDSRDG